jgi:hypothetical protein
MVYIVRLSVRLLGAGLVTFWIGVSLLEAQQAPDTQKAQLDSPAGKIAWQYNTNG